MANKGSVDWIIKFIIILILIEIDYDVYVYFEILEDVLTAYWIFLKL